MMRDGDDEGDTLRVAILTQHPPRFRGIEAFSKTFCAFAAAIFKIQKRRSAAHPPLKSPIVIVLLMYCKAQTINR